MSNNTLKVIAIRICQVMLLVFVVSCTNASDAVNSTQQTKTPCSNEWYLSIEEKVRTGDGQGHGPDVGSDEWKSVIEFKLGVRGKSTVPQRDSEVWCRYVDHLVQTE